MLSIENTKLLTYSWLLLVGSVIFVKHLVDSGILKILSRFKLSLTSSDVKYDKLLLPLLAIPIIYLLNAKHESDKNKDKKVLKRNSIITLVIMSVCIVSYYLTRWKIINGPFNYSDYFGSPGKDFAPIYKKI
tara:strand:+ start:5313 stop:5708 length:396 start_codon:yes stop_codon:yes gene_type:complete